METRPLEETVRRWSRRTFGYVFAYVGGGPYQDESRDRKWILGSFRRFSADDVREAIVQNKGCGHPERWQTLADSFGVN